MTLLSDHRIRLFIFSSALFTCIFCRTPEVTLRDSKVEPLVEKSLGISNLQLEKTLQKKAQSVDDLFILAMDRSEQMAAGAEDVYQAREKVMQAWGAIMPQLSFRMGLYAPDTGSTGTLFSRGFRFYARQPLLTGLDEYSAIRAGKIYENYTIEKFRAQAVMLYEQIAQVYFQYLQTSEELKSARDLLANTVSLKEELERRFSLGKIRRSEILSTEVIIVRSESRIASLKDSLASASSEIRRLTGMENDFVPEEISGVNMEIPLPKNDLRLEERPDIASLKLQWELARIDSLKAIGGHLPKVYLEGSYRLPQDAVSQGDYYGAIVAEVPIFSGGIVHSQVLVAQSRERQAKLLFDEALRNAVENYDYYLSLLESGKKIFELQQAAYRKAESNYEAIAVDYRTGQATNLEVLSALNERVNAKLDMEKTRLVQYLNFIRLQIIAGRLPGVKP